ERLAAGGAHLDGHLIRGTADAPRLDLDGRLDVLERLPQELERARLILIRALGDAVDRAVDDLLGDGLLAAVHDHVDELRQHRIPVLGIRQDVATRGLASSRHRCLSGNSYLSGSTLGPLGAVFRTALAAVVDAAAIERAAHDVVAHARQILDAAAADQHDRVLLQVVAFAADVARDLEAVRQAHACDLAHGRVRLLRRRRVDARADAALLRRGIQRRYRALRFADRPRFTDELVRCRHSLFPNK